VSNVVFEGHAQSMRNWQHVDLFLPAAISLTETMVVTTMADDLNPSLMRAHLPSQNAEHIRPT
jgi:hypothetical protein